MTTPRATLRALDAYWKAVTIVDPLRFDAWGEQRITLPLLRVLGFLRDQPGASTGDIGAHLGVTGAAVTPLMDRLAARGLARREQHPHDRRVIANYLEDAGAHALGEAVDHGSDFMEETLSELSRGELTRLATSLETFTAAAERVRQRSMTP